MVVRIESVVVHKCWMFIFKYNDDASLFRINSETVFLRALSGSFEDIQILFHISNGKKNTSDKRNTKHFERQLILCSKNYGLEMGLQQK